MVVQVSIVESMINTLESEYGSDPVLFVLQDTYLEF